MSFLFEIYLSIIRIFLLLTGVILFYIVGTAGYVGINRFLFLHYSPCLEIISFLTVFVLPLSLLYGILIKKFFWYRQGHYNFLIALIAYVVGIFFVSIPAPVFMLGSAQAVCSTHTYIIDHVAQAIATGSLIAIYAFVGMDVGVLLKHTSRKITSSKARTHIQTKRRKR